MTPPARQPHAPVTLHAPAARVLRLPAALKLAVALGLLLLVVASPWRGYAMAGGVAGGLLLVAVTARLNVIELLKRLLLLEPLVIGVAALNLTGPGGLDRFLPLLARSSACLLVMVVLAATTPFTEMLGVLRRARVPALLLTVVALTHRYLFLLRDERLRLQRARQSRTFARRRGAGSFVHSWNVLAGVVGMLFVRASERGERVYDAMRARGWR